MSASLDRLTAAVAKQTTTVAEVVAEVAALKAASSDDSAALDSLAAQVAANDNALAALVPTPEPDNVAAEEPAA